MTTLASRKWVLEILETDRIALKRSIVNYVDSQTRRSFMNDLPKRSRELRQTIQKFSAVIPPVIVKCEGLQLYDGYCRYAPLKDMKVSRLYAYVGAL
ncbi:hypothetical protein MUP07_03270 [Candidatus Bathyarchaeota archaeon]|nr:hypothetical protein [Candidatus Bathyarchaeota archaeon]